MFAPESYSNIYIHTMLLLTVVSCTLYARGSSGAEKSNFYSYAMSIVACFTMVLFLGTRPLSGVFIDMTTYAVSYNNTAFTGVSSFTDWAFAGMIEFLSKFFEVGLFFFICAFLYVVPLLWLVRVHGSWAFAVILAHFGGFSFFSYGVNVIRHGMAASLLIAAFCNRDRKWMMAGLICLSVGMHKAMLAPAAAFIAALFINSSWAMWTCWLVWLFSLAVSWLSRGAISDWITSISFFASEDRFLKYSGGIGNDKGGFRWDFILYSIVPIALTFALAGPAVRRDKFYRALIMTFLLTNSFWLFVIYAAYSDRFAYLSWFLLPWLIVYPFTPAIRQPSINEARAAEKLRLGWLALALLAHFSFTYFMTAIYYKGVF